MVLLGSVVNAVAIILGSLLGLFIKRIPDRMKNLVTQSISLVIIVIGFTLAMKTNQVLIVVFSLALGAVVGEWLDIESKLDKLGQFIESKFKSKNEGSISKGFVTSTLLFCVGAMAILGALDSGLRHNHEILFTKSMMDGFLSIILTSTLGIGVLLSAVPVLIYQGFIAIFASFVPNLVTQHLLDSIIAEISGTGGILLIALGLNTLGLVKMKIGNMLPSILFALIFVCLIQFFK
ncbi:DUF554 domain-containing protein [Bacillus sp. AFS041924]|uniref:DUF554 domain-containing protein n=1 Tax=Bacillus sp. AFS041924 TaxID=2033503 RepID=UPI000BFC32A7|nr:DUF554 domain-containing protein [Bacillus sp. AFS041924]PGS53446.1 hypothetical protein COC46_07460 [Bacillus sp. AFS041924]